jgi:hypothetical protein
VTPSPIAGPTPAPAPAPTPTPQPLLTSILKPTPARIKVAGTQVSASLAKVRFTVSGAPSTSQVVVTLRFGGKVIGTVTQPVGKGLSNARVAIAPANRKALRKRTRIRLQVEVKVNNVGTAPITKTFTVALLRKG